MELEPFLKTIIDTLLEAGPVGAAIALVTWFLTKRHVEAVRDKQKPNQVYLEVKYHPYFHYMQNLILHGLNDINIDDPYRRGLAIYCVRVTTGELLSVLEQLVAQNNLDSLSRGRFQLLVKGALDQHAGFVRRFYANIGLDDKSLARLTEARHAAQGRREAWVERAFSTPICESNHCILWLFLDGFLVYSQEANFINNTKLLFDSPVFDSCLGGTCGERVLAISQGMTGTGRMGI